MQEPCAAMSLAAGAGAVGQGGTVPSGVAGTTAGPAGGPSLRPAALGAAGGAEPELEERGPKECTGGAQADRETHPAAAHRGDVVHRGSARALAAAAVAAAATAAAHVQSQEKLVLRQWERQRYGR
jgi:hypothetical protein